MKTGIPVPETDEEVGRGSGTGIAARPGVMQGVMMTGHLGERGICLRIDEVVEEGAEVIEVIVMEEDLVDKVETEQRAQLLHRRRRNLHQT